MAEPMREVDEESWIEALNRFDEEIYPNLFEARGYTKAEALIVFSLTRVEGAIAELIEKIDAL